MPGNLHNESDTAFHTRVFTLAADVVGYTTFSAFLAVFLMDENLPTCRIAIKECQLERKAPLMKRVFPRLPFDNFTFCRLSDKSGDFSRAILYFRSGEH